MKRHRLISSLLLAFLLPALSARSMEELNPDSMDVGKVYRIEVLQVTDIEPYQESLDGFLGALEAQGFVQGRNLVVNRAKIDFDVEKAGFWSRLGVMLRIREEAQRIAAAKPDLALTIGTPATKHARGILEEARVPVTFTAVANPLDAGCPTLKDCGTNVTGATLYMDIADSLNAIRRVFPHVSRIGMVHTDDENGVAHVAAAKARAARLELAIDSREVEKSDNIVPALKDLYKEGSGIQLFAVPLDTYYGLRNFEPALDMSDYTAENGIPVVSLALVRVPGAVMYVGADFKEVGMLSGRQAVKILAKHMKPDVLPVLRQAQPTILFDPERAQALHIDIPETETATRLQRGRFWQLSMGK
ncbi:ABC transporter substrate-binding protein [Noviherbaspirillum galbum]|uniref:ABC transporter substrate-binding protein n=1 Tax=Noviherbaspirillum galbum TaxID=2709383 RepID=A0A6B3SMC9_9BURK|nr:ABC transporter substrate binding protein [Noviherbaspirillum galbum]NEX59532.1 hypothetical protein [Noviherbaspirillum galbum]